jgi:hypothetical protein
MRSDNSVLCAEHSGREGHLIILPSLATISPRAAQELPRDVLNCILGTAAVHMAVRNPGNQAIARLALETKVNLFEGINSTFREAQNQRADVLFVCTMLMYAMDVCSHVVVSYIKLAH